MPKEDKDLPWEIDLEQERSTNYVLNSADRFFCVTGETPNTTNKSQVRERIKEKRLKQLPTRFQDIIDDLALVEYSNEEFLDKEDWSDIWSEMSNLEERLDIHMDGNKYLSKADRSNESIQFGFKLGIISRHFISDGDWSKMSWGYLLGLHILPVGLADHETTTLNSTINELNDRAEVRSERIEAMKTSQDAQEQIDSENTDLIVNKLQSHGLDIESVPVPDTHLHSSIYSSQYRIDESSLEEAIQSNIENLKSLDFLRWAVEHDGNYIKSTGLYGDEAEPIVRELWYRGFQSYPGKSQFGLSVQDMDSINTAEMGKGILNKMSDGTRNEQETIHSVVTNEIEWKLTKYGQLVAYSVFELDCWYPWIYRYSLFGCSIPEKPQKLIEEAMTELEY